MKKKIFIFFLKLGVLLSVLIALFIGIVFIGGFGPISSSKELSDIKQAQASVVYSADKVLLGKYFLTNRTQITFDKLPKHLIEALIATEDVRFYEHNGIDKIALGRVFIKTLLLGNSSSGGGSTISQQLAKNLFQRKDFAFLSMPVNKTKEIILANRLETIYSKNDILTLYFNTVPFGEGVYGIEAASQRYFSIPTNKLTLEQAAVLVGMLKANTFYNPRKHPGHALRRRNTVLYQMEKAGFVKYHELKKALASPLNTNYKNLLLENPNGYYLHQVKKKASLLLTEFVKEDGTYWKLEKDGLIIETSLVSELQNSALEARKNHLIKLQKTMDVYWRKIEKQKKIRKLILKEWHQTKEYKHYKKQNLTNRSISDSARKKEKRFLFNWETTNKSYSKYDSISHYLKMVNAAIYAVDVNSGAIQIYVGGNNFEYLPYNLIRSERQAASIFKPFVYAAALENGQKPCDWINNEVKSYKKYENWKPENYDHSEGGYYSMPGALAKSMNIPTIETYFSVGLKKVQETTNALGLKKELKDLPSTALGTTNYSLQSLVHAYIPFATRNFGVAPYYISSIKDTKGTIIYQHKSKATNKETSLHTETLETMQYLLKGVVENGTARKLKSKYKTKGEWAGKTGTSQEYSDSWFIGFNSNFIIGSWVGCKYPSIHLPSSIGGGSVAALPIIGAIISKEYSNQTINKSLASGFPEFTETIIEECDCEFYREENTFEKIIDFFDKDKDEDEHGKKKEKRSFFSRLFGRK
jgi:penicillin-binding protein 1A